MSRDGQELHSLMMVINRHMHRLILVLNWIRLKEIAIH